jgi:hypothetical protein
MMRIVFTIFMALVFGQSAVAQFPCGVGHEESLLITERLLANKQTIKDGFVDTRDDIVYVPVKFHLIARSNGFQRIAESDVLLQLALLNRDYLDQDIQFYIESGFNYIDNTATFNDPSVGVANTILGNNKVNGRCNIFIPSTAQTGSGNPGTTLGFYSPSQDWIVIRQLEVRQRTPTLTHEMGHFLSLLHPHNGWDSAEFLANVSTFTPTPANSQNGVPTENQDRTGACKNCETAGDFLCDTPPDYNFGFGWPDCEFDLGTLDPCGDAVDPEETLFMGYFLTCDDGTYTFSNDQKDLMLVDLNNRKTSNTIFANLVPSTTAEVEGNTDAFLPANGGESPMAESVYFNWTPVPGATNYIFQVSRDNFSSGVTQVILEDGKNDVTITGEFEAGVDYIWRVYPYNEVSTGAGFSETFTFTTGAFVNVETIEEVSSFELYPNVLTNHGEVVLDINSDASFDADIQIINLSGQVVLNRSDNILSGSNKINLALPTLSQGVYFVKVNSKSGVISKKLIVQ